MRDTVAVITGAASGIGRACARLLSAEGARLVLVDLNGEQIDALAAELPCPAISHVGSIAERETAFGAVDAAVAEFGRLDTVLANAGLYLGGDLTATEVDDIERLIAVNVQGAITTVRAALPLLVKQGHGNVIVTSSISGHQDIHVEPVYSASKHAVQAFVHGVRRQVAGSGVRIGAVAPGIVLSPLWGFAEGDSGIQEKVAEGAGIRSDDVAGAVLFMLSRPAHVTIRDLVILPTNQEI